MIVREPQIPTADRTITLTSATEAALSSAIDQARVGEVTKIVLPKGQTIHFTSSWATKNITGKDIVIDFNGATIQYDVDTGLSFRGSYVWTKAVSTLGVANGDTVLTLAAGVPSDLKVGDWLKIVSDDTTPGDRATNRYMGEALQIKAISGNKIIFDGQLDDQQLYQTNIRAGKYADGSVTLVNPSTVGSTSYKSYHINLETMVDPTIISPDAHKNGWAFINLLDTVRALITDPTISTGNPDLASGYYPYGIEIQSGTQTAILDDDAATDVTQVRHAVDASQPWVTSKANLASYGATHDTYIQGLDIGNMFSASIGSHSGGRGMLYDGIRIHDTALAVTVRGQNQVYKDLQVINVDRGIQFYNESNQWQKNGSIDSYNIFVVGGTFDVKKMGFFTSGLAGDMLIDEIHFQNTTWTFSGTGWFSFLDNSKGDWSFVNDTIKLTGNASTLMRVAGQNTHVTVDGMIIDLTSFKGTTLKLFDVDAGSTVDVTRLTIINPNNVKILAQSGAGDVQVTYGTRVDQPLPADMPDIFSAAFGAGVTTDAPSPTNGTDSTPIPSSTDSATPPQPAAQAPTNSLAAYQGNDGVVYDVTLSDLNRGHRIYDFDNTGIGDGKHDIVDVSRIFEYLGGKYTDGVNDVRDRINAVHIENKDLDGDGKADDILLTVDGQSKFKIEFIDPKGDVSVMGVSWGGGQYDDVNVMNRIAKGDAITQSVQASRDAAGVVTLIGLDGRSDRFTFSDPTQKATIKNFDSRYFDDLLNDVVDLRGVFKALGGAYTDGVQDAADRAAAVVLTKGDFDSDGVKDDVRLTIKGAADFAVTFIDPTTDVVAWFDLDTAKTGHDDILIA